MRRRRTPLGVVVRSQGQEAATRMDGDDVFVADDPGPTMRELLDQLKGQVDRETMVDGRLLDLESGRSRTEHFDRLFIDEDRNRMPMILLGALVRGDVWVSHVRPLM